MAQDYTVTTWQPWLDRDTDEPIRDAHGNYQGTVYFEQDPRGVDARFKKEPQPGDKKYGDLVDYTTKAGKTRVKFQRADRPQEGGSFGGGSASKSSYQPRDDDAIRAQWAIGQSVAAHGASPQLDVNNMESVEAYAKELFSMVAKVKATDKVVDVDLGEPVSLDDIPF